VVRSKFRDGIRQRSLQREHLERNPMAWLADRDRPRRRWVWCFPALTIWLWMRFQLDPLGNPAAQAGFVAFVAIHVFFKIWLSADASYAFATGRRDGTLELLLLTPLSAREIAAGTLSGFRRRYLAPLLALFLLDVALAAWLALVEGARARSSSARPAPCCWLIPIVCAGWDVARIGRARFWPGHPGDAGSHYACALALFRIWSSHLLRECAW